MDPSKGSDYFYDRPAVDRQQRNEVAGAHSLDAGSEPHRPDEHVKSDDSPPYEGDRVEHDSSEEIYEAQPEGAMTPPTVPDHVP